VKQEDQLNLQMKLLEQMLQEGTAINCQNNLGDTPLHHGAS
jgi:hypothetical protein